MIRGIRYFLNHGTIVKSGSENTEGLKNFPREPALNKFCITCISVKSFYGSKFIKQKIFYRVGWKGPDHNWC